MARINVIWEAPIMLLSDMLSGECKLITCSGFGHHEHVFVLSHLHHFITMRRQVFIQIPLSLFPLVLDSSIHTFPLSLPLHLIVVVEGR